MFFCYLYVAYFPRLDTYCMLSRALRQLHAFPRFAAVTCFPVLDAGCIFAFKFGLVRRVSWVCYEWPYVIISVLALQHVQLLKNRANLWINWRYAAFSSVHRVRVNRRHLMASGQWIRTWCGSSHVTNGVLLWEVVRSLHRWARTWKIDVLCCFPFLLFSKKCSANIAASEDVHNEDEESL